VYIYICTHLAVLQIKNTNSSILLCAFKALVFSFFFTAIYTYINLEPSTARVFGDKGGVNDLDDVTCLRGKKCSGGF
jgi:hypothetical protein